MNIFIDSNILLDFYRFTKGDLEELRKIARLSKTGRIRLLVSDYLRDEFYRNRENEIARSIKLFESNQTDWSIPNIFTAYPEFIELNKIKNELKKTKIALLDAVRKDIHKSSLIADSVIADLFESAKVHIVSEAILKLGADRAVHARTPGKRGSCGDAVHWEWLLAIMPNNENLTIISEDEDFQSRLYPGVLSSYLSEEWNKKKGSKCKLYTSLSSFLKVHFPKIKIADDVDKIYAAELQIIARQFTELNSLTKPAWESMRAIFTEVEKNLSIKEFKDMFRLLGQFSSKTNSPSPAAEDGTPKIRPGDNKKSDLP